MTPQFHPQAYIAGINVNLLERFEERSVIRTVGERGRGEQWKPGQGQEQGGPSTTMLSHLLTGSHKKKKTPTRLIVVYVQSEPADT